MNKADIRIALMRRHVLRGIVKCNLVLDADGKIAGPEDAATWAADYPWALTPETRALLAAYLIESMPHAWTVTGLLRAMSQLVGPHSPSTTFSARPLVRICRERQAAIARMDGEWVQNAYRIIRPDGVLVVPVKGWEPSNEALDLACMYHMVHERTEIDDQYALTRFVLANVDRLSVAVLWQYVDLALFSYIEDGSGVIVGVLDKIELRQLGRRIYARDGMVEYLAGNPVQGLELLAACGFVDP